MIEGFCGRKRLEQASFSYDDKMYWGIVNMQMYVDGDSDCFVKEVPVSDSGSGYMTYECGFSVAEATLYNTKEFAERLIECYHMSNRVYMPICIKKRIEYWVDPDCVFTDNNENEEKQ